MRLTKQQNDFIKSQAGLEARQLLEEMVLDDSYNTEPSYTANTAVYPDNLIPFVDKHMNYLCTHAIINPQLYLSHLRLMTRVKGNVAKI